MNTHDACLLGDVAEIVRGISFKPEDVVELGTPGTIACMRTKNVQQHLDQTDVWSIPVSFVKRDDQRLRLGDILVSSANSWNLVGKCCWIPDLPWESTFGGFVSVLRANPARVEPRYLYHWFASDRIQTTVRSFGQQTTNISNLNTARTLALRFPLPTLPEQRRIANILDKADALRAKRRAALAQLETLKQAIFLEMLGDPGRNPKGWPIRKIGDLITSATYGTSEKSGSTGEYPVLRMNNLTRTGEMNLSDLKYMDLSEDQRDRYLVRAGDVLFNRTNSPELVGKTAIYRGTSPLAYAGYLIRVRVNRENDPEYLAAFLNTDYSKRVLRGMCKSIIGMANINAKELQTIRIPQPPLELQREFAVSVSSIEKLRTDLGRSLSQLEVLFAALQSRAFRGDL